MRLHSQLTYALQVIVDLVQCAFSGLGDRDAVVGVALSLGQALDLSGHAVGNGLAGGVVLGAVDAQAGGQTLHGGGQGALGGGQVLLGDHRSDVGIDDGHADIP
ncbi:hypothetical protein D9M71_548580 [compost metagenome]